MKRWLCVCTILALLFSTVAGAEGFSLRNGIMFGDTMDEVMSKETIPIESTEDRSEGETEGSSEENKDGNVYSVHTERATIAGVDDSYIVYYFGADKTLREVMYYFCPSTDPETVDSDYESVNDGLKRKYGDPLGYTDGKCYIYAGAALDSCSFVVNVWNNILDGVAGFRNYDEWDVKTDDYHVKIDHVEIYTGNAGEEVAYSHMLSYNRFTEADLVAAMLEKQDSENEVDSDL